MNETAEEIKAPSNRSGEPRKFARDILWVGVAQLFNSIIVGVGTMPALTKYYPPDVYGIWAQIQVTYGLLSPLIAMQLSLAVVRFLSGENDKVKRRQVLGAMLFAITIISIVFFIAGLLFSRQFSVILFNTPDYSTYAILTVIWIIVSAYFGFFISYMRARGRIKLLSIRQVIVALLTLGIVIFMATRGISLEWIVASVISIWLVFTLVFFMMVIKEIGFPYPNTKGLKDFLAFSAPQMPGGVLLWIILSSDRYLITHFLGLDQTGIYNSSWLIGSLTSLFYIPIQFVLFPTLSRFWEERKYVEVKSYLEYSTRLFLTLAIPATAGIALLSQPILRILTTSQYLVGDILVFLIGIGSLFLGMYQINVNIVMLLKKTQLLPLLIGAASIVSIIINIILIPRFGLIGAAVANMISFIILAVIVSIWARKQVGYGIDVKYLLKVVGATVVMSAFLYFFNTHGIGGLILAAVAGTLIYLVSLFLLKGFSQQDRKLIRNVTDGIIPSYIKKHLNIQ